jgi:hypothetical protein
MLNIHLCCKCGSGACIIHEGPDGAVVVTCECGTLLGSWRELMNIDSTSTRDPIREYNPWP